MTFFFDRTSRRRFQFERKGCSIVVKLPNLPEPDLERRIVLINRRLEKLVLKLKTR
jgi:hypothetical protein